ncbi:MAG: hypothetical protein JWL70_3236 [Acidimicrobiia bacterium]|nr:hypothetical protein [Acidimicrobiia bacterium]
MAAPQHVPVPATEKARVYSSPDYVPDQWMWDRPADLDGRQPSGVRLGSQGPDQGYALVLAERLRPAIVVQPGESVDDAIWGCLGVALRRASIFGRAPVIHDLTVGFTVFGFLDPAAPADLVAYRRPLFEGVRHVGHHYGESRAIVDSIPETTLRLLHGQVTAGFPARWREFLGQ